MATAAGLPTPAAEEFEVHDQWEISEQVGLWEDTWRRLRRNRLAVIGMAFIVLIIITGIVSHFWTPYDTWRQAIGPTYQGPTLKHPLGLDDYGRDILSRLMGGALIAIQVGIGASLIASTFGVVMGLIAGFYRGWVDWAISLLINIFYGIPDLLVALIFVVLFGRSLQNVVFAIAITGWLGMARLVRGQAMSLREREFVEAARSIGTRDLWILFRHIFPNALSTIVVQATYLIPAAIIFEAFLSLVGLGVPPPAPSWGAMASQGFKALQIAPHIALIPSIALALTVLSFNWFGDGLRDALDPRMRK
jgi:ABC-type dipeptide/oligopeptide/nickel transport system permease subunit